MFNGLYTLLTLLIVFTALFAYVNYRFIRLPATIGIMLISLLCSIGLVVTKTIFPGMLKDVTAAVTTLDFHSLFMDVMLSFLLFAGSFHINLEKLKAQSAPIITFATVSVLISTTFIGFSLYYIFPLFNWNVPLILCFLFGALISPTDPIAVLGILKSAKIPQALETKIAGESLFNDGVGVVIFVSILEVAKSGIETFSAGDILLLFVKEAGGGIVWGLALGYIGFLLLKSIDNYKVEVLITLAMVMGGYLLANKIGVSGPLAMVAAGITTGNKTRSAGMSEITEDYLNKFWELIDEILNAVLFLLIGLEMLIIEINQPLLWISAITVLVALTGRLISVSIPVWLLSYYKTFEAHTITLLTWGGLRGGISVALALSLPGNMYRDQFVTITYVVVIFSIFVQGLTLARVAKKLVR